jgi:hypothetical protein
MIVFRLRAPIRGFQAQGGLDRATVLKQRVDAWPITYMLDGRQNLPAIAGDRLYSFVVNARTK